MDPVERECYSKFQDPFVILDREFAKTLQNSMVNNFKSF